MKTIKLFYLLLAALSVFTFASCSDDDEEEQLVVIDFENIALPDAGHIDSLKYKDKGISFYNNYTVSEFGPYWDGFSFSMLTDKTTPGYGNQYSVYADGGAAKSEKFAVVYYPGNYGTSPDFTFTDGKARTLKSAMINNSTYARLSVQNGDGFGKKFEASDWFKVIFTGYNTAGDVAGKVEYYLADYRNGKSYICSQWTEVSLESLGKVNKVVITFDSSDINEQGIKTPSYVCLDNLTYIAE